MNKPKTALGMPGVFLELPNPDRFPNDEVIKAHNEGRLELFIAQYLHKQFTKKFVGQVNTEELQHAMKAVLIQTTRHLEELGVIDPNVHVVEVRQDGYDPTLVHVSVNDKRLLLVLGPNGIPEDKAE